MLTTIAYGLCIKQIISVNGNYKVCHINGDIHDTFAVSY